MSKSVNHSARAKPKKKRWMQLSVIGVVVLLLVIGGVYAFFQTHFLPSAEANSIEIGWMSVKSAKEMLEKSNRSEEILINTGDQQAIIQLPEKYQITEEFLKQHVGEQSIDLPINEQFTVELDNQMNALEFPPGEESSDASIQLTEAGFEIVPETYGTTVDKEALKAQMLKDIRSNKGNYEYDTKDFYTKPKIKQDDKTLADQLALLKTKSKKKITLDVKGKKVILSTEQIQSLLNNDGTIDEEATTLLLNNLNVAYASAWQSVTFTDIHGTKRRFKNNGSYGWNINVEKAQPQLIKALNSKKNKATVVLALEGDPEQPANITKTYVEIDLNDQKMYFFKNGKKVVDTSVITGRYHKGTATVPGFHTILYKETDVELQGEMLDGSTYEVPVKYWMPLLSYGGVVTQIGIHDADYKTEYFGDKEAYLTNLGSNGCINTPGDKAAKIFKNAYEGMPVFIYGDIYDYAPGEFDKPVDYGEII